MSRFIPNVGADNNYNSKIDPSVVRVESVSISGGNVTLQLDETAQLQAVVLPNNANNKNVTWSSSQPSVVSVDANGLVTALSDGSASIQVTTEDGGFTASTTIIVGGDDNDVIVEVLNGDFENGLNHWNYWGGAATGTPSFYGGNSVKITGPGAVNQWVKVKPNTTYTLSAFAMVEDPNNDKLIIGVNNEKNNPLGDRINVFDTEYTLQNMMFTTGATTDSIKVLVWRPSGGVQNSYADEVVVKETAYAINATFDKGLIGWSPWGTGTVSNSSSMMKVVGYGGANQVIKTKANTTYEITIEAKVDDASVHVNFQVAENGGSNYLAEKITATQTTEFTFTFTTNSEDTKIGFWRPSGSTAGAYLDNISIKEVSNARTSLLNNDLEEQLSLLVYPNPARSMVTITVGELETPSQLHVYNIEGRPLFESVISNRIELDLHEFRSGLYFIVVTDSNGQKQTKKLYIK
ncbi:T9SS type A sorting domain-containing protein [Flammeovirga sp. MY04]|uniref:Ig-like domain-containing protein n=1 Tax=Flammeovirga sp. MY04 TaxID=1191459 RepID=UPI0008062294|nr:Ig-like domain-containing protein [Flammeovirga sp. MY04]ANQ52462.1 T9SS type A sorting domain-containing protein [Flammeovirga sp. MY04]